MEVVEIFRSIQGEGDLIGKPAIFIRFAGCNLDCPFCDESDKYYLKTEMKPKEIHDKVKEYYTGKEMIVITGGEPFLQNLDELEELIGLLKHEYFIAIETNGTIKNIFIQGNWVTVSPKPPKYDINLLWLNEIKLVVNKETVNEVKNFLISYSSPVKWMDFVLPVKPSIWLQPDSNDMKTNCQSIITLINNHNLMTSSFYNLKAGIQLHKIYNIL